MGEWKVDCGGRSREIFLLRLFGRLWGKREKILSGKGARKRSFFKRLFPGAGPAANSRRRPCQSHYYIHTYIHCTYIQTKNIMYTVAPKTIGQSRESGHILPISTRQLKSSLSDSVLCVFASICYLLCVCSNTTVDTYSSWMLPYKAL